LMTSTAAVRLPDVLEVNDVKAVIAGVEALMANLITKTA
jgi:hypothetical protein